MVLLQEATGGAQVQVVEVKLADADPGPAATDGARGARDDTRRQILSGDSDAGPVPAGRRGAGSGGGVWGHGLRLELVSHPLTENRGGGKEGSDGRPWGILIHELEVL